MFVDVQGRLTRPQPLDYGVAQGLMTALCGRYACLRRVVIGHSVLGREVSALVCGPSAVTRVLMVSALDAQEWLTALCVLRLCEEIGSHLRGDLPLYEVPLAAALRRRQVWFVPLPNPDGVEIARYGSIAAGGFAATAARRGADTPSIWQGNACGVSLSSNFTAGWDEMQALPRKNGENPTIQAETAALSCLCHRLGFRYAVVLGGIGERVEWYRGDPTPPQSRLMAQVLAAVSGYAVTSDDSADFGGWFVHTFRRPALTLRMGKGPLPLPVRGFETLYRTVGEALLLALLF